MEIIVVCDNIRSTHNVGSILRTCDGLGIKEVYTCGVTPYPKIPSDTRLPHIADKVTRQIYKTALGAEETINIIYSSSAAEAIEYLKSQGYYIFGLEQAHGATILDAPSKIQLSEKCAIVLGTEVNGIALDTIDLCDSVLELPMVGKKESYNVSVAAGIVLYYLRYMVQ